MHVCRNLDGKRRSRARSEAGFCGQRGELTSSESGLERASSITIIYGQPSNDKDALESVQIRDTEDL